MLPSEGELGDAEDVYGELQQVVDQGGGAEDVYTGLARNCYSYN